MLPKKPSSRTDLKKDFMLIFNKPALFQEVFILTCFSVPVLVSLLRQAQMRREGLFLEFISFVNNPDGTPRYENIYKYAILKKEWDKKNMKKWQGNNR